jgi:hypothetical protein
MMIDYKLGQTLYRVYQDSMIEYKVFDIGTFAHRVGILQVGGGDFYLSIEYLKSRFFTSEKEAWQEHRKNLAIQIENDRKQLEQLCSKMDDTVKRLAAIDFVILGLNS